MAKREVVGRYRGSLMGVAWSLLHPVLMLLAYTFVFGFVFKARWSAEQPESKVDFALVLFVGMIVHGIVAECLNKAPTVVSQHANFVKKVVFPLEVLPVVSLCSAIFHGAVSVGVLLIALTALRGIVAPTAVALPAVLLPLLVLTLGITWALASLGVYVRDLGQTMGIVTTLLLFLSPIFYPLSAVPPEFLPVIKLNPLTFYIEQSRDVLIWGRWPDWMPLVYMLLTGCAVAWIGYWWFQKTRKGFADVL